MVKAYEIAEAFVGEYLSRQPEFIDVVEFVEEEFGSPKRAKMEKIYEHVVALIDDEAIRFADRNN